MQSRCKKATLKCMKKTFKEIKNRIETMKKSKLKKTIVFKRTVAHLLTKTAIKKKTFIKIKVENMASLGFQER